MPWQKLTSTENKLFKIEKALEESKKRIKTAEMEQQTAKRELELQKIMNVPSTAIEQSEALNAKEDLIKELKRKLISAEKMQKQLNDECLRLNDTVFEQSALL